jgi:hypothetical protein
MGCAELPSDRPRAPRESGSPRELANRGLEKARSAAERRALRAEAGRSRTEGACSSTAPPGRGRFPGPPVVSACRGPPECDLVGTSGKALRTWFLTLPRQASRCGRPDEKGDPRASHPPRGHAKGRGAEWPSAVYPSPPSPSHRGDAGRKGETGMPSASRRFQSETIRLTAGGGGGGSLWRPAASALRSPLAVPPPRRPDRPWPSRRLGAPIAPGRPAAKTARRLSSPDTAKAPWASSVFRP